MAQPAKSANYESKLTEAKENYNQGNYPKSLEKALEVYRLSSQHLDQPTIANAGNIIGLVYLAQGQVKTSLKYFKDAENINRVLNNTHGLAANLLNISLAQSQLHMLDSAVVNIKKSLEISNRYKYLNLIAMGKNHLADYYREQGHLKAAEKEFMSVINDKAFQSDWENSFAYTGLAKIRYSQKQYRVAGLFSDKAFTYAEKTETKWDAVQALELAHKAYWAMGDTKKAYQRLLNYKTYSDSIFNSKKDNEINSLFLKEKSIENDNLLKEIHISAQKRKIDRLIIAIILVLITLLSLIAILIFKRSIKTARYNRSLMAINKAAITQNKLFEQQNNGLNKLNHHKDKLLSIIGHDLRSPFAVLQNTLDLFKSGDLNAEELVMLTNQLAEQLTSSSWMLDSLLVWAGNQLNGSTYNPVYIHLPEKINKIISVLSAPAKRKNITIEHCTEDLPQVFCDADQVRIMIQNLLANAIKFTGENGIIKIGYTICNTYIDLTIKDNGVGMQQEELEQHLSFAAKRNSTYGTFYEKGIGLGLQLVKEFAAKNDVEISGETAPGVGTAFTLRFKTEYPDTL
ncbi:tetratricopeptide repeat-containing sensor histidine kinase [Mucilaginibacter sp. KACC 22063]|uniref:tetratricopeptide repeat-containing sensor histidine kinase n=1 Tax=Mucilaginibacter sp. KACC 22063 TaxID=3025666 RepID=UPI0023666656|nr:tetratricopeptide repeat-containing sensor histidine kinase [Mucilaginibacter sp. KACC 22063]WDF53930.1 tetratricopeptide repeat-containing sensor histidine kinase [Mucilaginibacter sp. KACC 22063]